MASDWSCKRAEAGGDAGFAKHDPALSAETAAQRHGQAGDAAAAEWPIQRRDGAEAGAPARCRREIDPGQSEPRAARLHRRDPSDALDRAAGRGLDQAEIGIGEAAAGQCEIAIDGDGARGPVKGDAVAAIVQHPRAAARDEAELADMGDAGARAVVQVQVGGRIAAALGRISNRDRQGVADRAERAAPRRREARPHRRRHGRG